MGPLVKNIYLLLISYCLKIITFKAFLSFFLLFSTCYLAFYNILVNTRKEIKRKKKKKKKKKKMKDEQQIKQIKTNKEEKLNKKQNR